MWPEPITPNKHFFEGAQALGVEVRRLAGVLETPTISRKKMQRKLKIKGKNRNRPTAYLASGALGALRKVFENLAESYENNPPKDYNVVIDSRELNIPIFQPNHNMIPLFKRNRRRIPLIDQSIAYDLIITRAGGGAVNAAIAGACPWVSITEPLHPQVNGIAEAARKMGINRCIPYDVFADDPRGTIERQLLGKEVENRRIRAKLYEQASQAELRFADGVLREFLG